jgi:hypothetical protein
MVTNCLLSDVGHLSLPVNSRAVRLVANALASPLDGRWPT